MSGSVNLHEGEVAIRFNCSDLAMILVSVEMEVFHLGCGILLMFRIVKRICPGFVPEPVADEVGITRIYQDGHLLNQAWH